MSNVSLPELVLVEDTLDDELMSIQGITRSGIPCRITVQRDGVEALEHLLGETTPPPTLIVLDFKLPRMNGLEVLQKLRLHDRTRLIPVVIVSGTNAGPVMTECYRIGANSCVTKPDDPTEYVERMAAVTSYWLRINQCASQLALGPSRRMMTG